MEQYSDFDYLCDEPFYLYGIGAIKSPTLRDIRKISYNVFSMYLNIITISKEQYIKVFGSEELYNQLSDKNKESNSLFKLIICNKQNSFILMGILSFFLKDSYRFNTSTLSFDIYTKEENDESKETITGHIGENNFEVFRDELKCILGFKKPSDAKQKFKNKMAEQLFQKMQKSAAKQQKKHDENMTVDNMIVKYCTHNKVGINILNVWDLTYYQFLTMFDEYCRGRQADFNDLMAANTFSYKKSSDYKPMDYMKKIK